MEKKQKIIYEEGDIFNAFLDFRNDLTEELKKVIETRIPKQDGISEQKLLKNKDLKKLLGCSDSTLENLRNSGALNYSKVLGTYYYTSKDLESMLDRNKSQFSNN